jgi:methylmalonyl-CoA mutase cobalamin-binding subunit
VLPRCVLFVRFEEVSVVLVTLGVVITQIDINILKRMGVKAIIVMMVVIVSTNRVRMSISGMVVEVTRERGAHEAEGYQGGAQTPQDPLPLAISHCRRLSSEQQPKT